jgi:mannose-1-phosphate guanylyltransferase
MKALILAGGLGTRMRPLTDSVPKSLLPIANRPFLEHQIRLLADHGARDATLLTGYLADEFADFAEQMKRSLGVTLHISTEEKPLGTAGAVATQRAHLDGTTVVFNGDVLTDLDISAMLDVHRSSGALVTIALTHVEDARPYGLVPAGDTGRVEAFLEKQPIEQPGWINAGTYVVEPRALDDVPPGEFWQFEQQLFPALLEHGEPVFAFRSDAYWLDIGTPERYLQAHYDVLDGRARCAVEGQILTDSKSFDDGTELRAPVLLSHAPVAPGAIIGPHTTLGPRSKVGARARVERSVVHADAEIGEDAVVTGSIVGRGARVEPGTTLDNAVVA